MKLSDDRRDRRLGGYRDEASRGQSAPKARYPRKSGRQAVEGKPQRVKIYDFASRGSFSKEGAAELFCGRRSNDGGVKLSDDRRDRRLGGYRDEASRGQSAPKARYPQKSGRQAVEGKPQRVKIYDVASRGSFSKEGAAELFSGRRSNDGGVKFSDGRRKQHPGGQRGGWRGPRKSGRQAVEGKPQRVKIYDFASRGSFSKEGAAELFCGKRSNDGGVKFSDGRRKQHPGGQRGGWRGPRKSW